MRSHGAFIQGSNRHGNPFPSLIAVLWVLLYFIITFFGSGSATHICISICSHSFVLPPTIAPFSFLGPHHFIAYFWESLPKCISHCCVGEIGVNAARNQAKICLAFSFVFAWGVSLRFSGLRLWNRDLALGFFGPHSNILVPCLFAICCYVCLSLLTNGIWLEDFCCLVFMEILALNDSHLKFV